MISVRGHVRHQTRKSGVKRNRPARPLRGLLLAATALGGAQAGQAQVAPAPAPFAVTQGQIQSYDVSGSVQTVTQSSARAVLEWTDLSVAGGNTLQFVQPDRNSITLNRVTGGNFSAIEGSLTANGQVWILNPNGVLVGASGQISAAGFLATTAALAISDSDFVGGTNSFEFNNGTSSGITNQGVIDAGSGYVALLGARVANERPQGGGDAIIRANLGTVALGSGTAFTVDLQGDRLISFAVNAPSLSGSEQGIFNSGRLVARGGSVLMTARAARGVIDNVINTTGLVEALSVVERDGVIVLDAGNAGMAVNGVVDASGVAEGTRGGSVSLIGGTVSGGNAPGGLLIDASGVTRGGTIAVNANGGTSDIAAIAFGAGATLQASATGLGDGGSIDLQVAATSQSARAIAHGLFRADGGTVGGSGGRIALSARTMDLAGISARASVRGSTGLAGQFVVTAQSLEVIDQISADVPGWFSATPGLVGDPALMTALGLYDDQVAPQVPLGFTFRYMGVDYDAVDISSNGFLSFTSLGGDSWCCQGLLLDQPGSSSPVNSIFALWTDLISFDGLTPSYRTETLADGSRRFIAGWYHTYEFYQAALNDFEIVLADSGRIQINYGAVDVVNHAVTAGATGTTADQSLLLYSNLFGSPTVDLTVPVALAGKSFATTLTGQGTQIETGLVSTLLSGGTNVVLNGANGDVKVSSAIAKSGNGAAALLLQAARDVIVAEGADISATAGLAVSLLANSGQNGSGVIRLGANIATGVVGALPVAGTVAAPQPFPRGIVLNGNTVLTGNATLASSGGISVFGQVDSANAGAYGLTVQTPAAPVRFTGAIGSNGALAGLAVSAARLDTVAINAGSGTIALDLGSDSVIAGDIVASALTKSGLGLLRLTGNSGALQSLRVNAGTLLVKDGTALGQGTVTLGGGALAILPDGDITLSNDISLAGDSEIRLLGDHAFTLLSDIDGPHELSINAWGSLALGGTIGATTALGALDIISSGVLTLDAAFSARAASDIRLGAVSRFVNLSPNASVLQSLSGRWLVWSGNRTPFLEGSADVVGQLAHDFRYYGITEAQVRGEADLPAIPAGNGLAYSRAPVAMVSAVGAISKTYDGSAVASLGSDVLQVAGGIHGDVLSVAAGSATYDSKDAGTRSVQIGGIRVTAIDTAGKPVYGYGHIESIAASGTITPRELTAALTGSVQRSYDGTTLAALGTGNFAVGNLVTGESLTITRNTGTFASKDTGSGLAVSATLGAGDFTAGSGTLLSNYVLPTQASGLVGTITPRDLTVALTGSVQRSYDGTTLAALGTGNFAVGNLVTGESLTITRNTGTFASKDAGSGLAVSATLGAGDFTAGSGTLLSNYVLPTLATGRIGTITPRDLTVALTGSVQRSYDGTTLAALGTGNFAVGNLVAGESLTITRNTGTFASKDAGSGLAVSATLGASDFTAGSGTLLSNYLLPTLATGRIGTITRLSLTYVADPARRYTGQPNPTFTGSVQGFITGESVSSATSGSLSFTSTATTASEPGEYAIVGSGLSATNYDFVQATSNAKALLVMQNVLNQVANVAQSVVVPTPTVVSPVTTPTATAPVSSSTSSAPAPSATSQSSSSSSSSTGSSTTTSEASSTSASGSGSSGGDSSSGGTGSGSEGTAATDSGSASGTGSSSSSTSSGGGAAVADAPASAPAGGAPSAPADSGSSLGGGATGGGAVTVAVVAVAAPAVEATPPSPVPQEAPATPSDSDDQADPILQMAVAPSEVQQVAQAARTIQVMPGLLLAPPPAPPSPRSSLPQVASMDFVGGSGW